MLNQIFAILGYDSLQLEMQISHKPYSSVSTPSMYRLHFLPSLHTWDGKNPFNGQKERFFQLSFGQRNVRIHNLQQFHHCIHTEVRLSVLRWSKKKKILQSDHIISLTLETQNVLQLADHII